jgi:signal transduction histidine kinase
MRIEELGTLDRAKSALFSNVAQELFVPLALVPGPLDDAISDMPPGAHREGLVIARRNVRRLTRLVGILRDISNLEAGQFRGKFQLVNLGELTRDGAVS